MKEAEESYRKAISINKGYIAAFRGLGATLIKKGVYDEGLINLRKADGSIFFNVKNGISIKSEV